MRVYLPLRSSELASVDETGVLPSRSAFGVTAAMRSAEPTADEEDLEFDAMCVALDAAAGLGGGGLRVVAAADVEGDPVADGREAAVGEIASVPIDDVVSFHVEERPGGEGEGYDSLLWYDVTELSEITDLGSSA